MKSSRVISSDSNKYLVVKLYKLPQPPKRKHLMNTCEELIKQIMAKVKNNG